MSILSKIVAITSTASQICVRSEPLTESSLALSHGFLIFFQSPHEKQKQQFISWLQTWIQCLASECSPRYVRIKAPNQQSAYPSSSHLGTDNRELKHIRFRADGQELLCHNERQN